MKENNGHRIIENMGRYRYPDVPRPHIQVTKQSAQHGAGQETVKLEVNGAENNGGKPHGHMRVVQSFQELPEYDPPENQLLTYSRNHPDNQDIHQQLGQGI